MEMDILQTATQEINFPVQKKVPPPNFVQAALEITICDLQSLR